MAEKLGLGIGGLIGASIIYKFVRGSSEKKDDEITIQSPKLAYLDYVESELEDARLKITDLNTKLNGMENKDMESRNTICLFHNEGNRLKSENDNLQQTINHLHQKIKETEKELAKESKQASGNLKMLTKERQQSKKAQLALRRKCIDVQSEKAQLDKELTQLKEIKLVKIQTALDDLNNRAQAINDQNQKSFQNCKRNEFTSKFQTLKNENDRMIRDLQTVTFTTRLYQNDHETLLKIQEKTKKRDRDYFTKMQQISEGCKLMIEEYNSSIPERFLNTIINHEKDLDLLEKHNFNSKFEIEAAIHEKILHGLSKEREMLEGILKVEKSNCLIGQDKSCNKSNLQYINNLNSENTYPLIIYNMPEASDHLSDIKNFESFMRLATGRNITCCGLLRFGAPKKTPRSAKVTLKSKKDFDDVLNGKNVPEYSFLRVQKFVS